MVISLKWIISEDNGSLCCFIFAVFLLGLSTIFFFFIILDRIISNQAQRNGAILCLWEQCSRILENLIIVFCNIILRLLDSHATTIRIKVTMPTKLASLQITQSIVRCLLFILIVSEKSNLFEIRLLNTNQITFFFFFVCFYTTDQLCIENVQFHPHCPNERNSVQWFERLFEEDQEID